MLLLLILSFAHPLIIGTDCPPFVMEVAVSSCRIANSRSSHQSMSHCLT